MATIPKKSPIPIERAFKISLWQSFNTPLHRAGLGGLYMSLKHLESYKGKVIDWDLSSDSITLRWNCSDKQALSWLLNHTYQLSGSNDSANGVIAIPCLGTISTDTKITIHNGMLNTFLQHPSSVGGDGIKSQVLHFEDNQTLEVKYKAIKRYNHQDLKPFAKKGLYDKQDNFLPYIRIAQWLYPGATEKHVAVTGGKTRWQETPEGFISLLFAPIGCSYYKVKSRLFANKYRWCLIIPHINNLQRFARIRLTEGFQVVKYENYFASGISDASLSYLLMLAGKETGSLQATPSCSIWAFGDVPWSQQQTITKHQTVSVDSQETKKIYKICAEHLSKGIKVGKNGTYIDVSFGREIASENLVAGKPWYSGLHDILKFKSEVFAELFYERKSLQEMKEAMISQQVTSEMATLFVDVFTWQYYEKIRELQRNTSSGKPNYEKLKTDLLISIRNCRSYNDFVRLQISVFSRPSTAQNPFLEETEVGDFYPWSKQNWQDCLALMTLAIVGYQNPWLNPRTEKILISKGRNKPKYLRDKDNGNLSDTKELDSSESNTDNSDDSYEGTDTDSLKKEGFEG